MDTAELLAALADPRTWPGPGGPGAGRDADPGEGVRTGAVTLIETHLSVLALVGERVYKLKKAVDLGFVDQREPARRRFLCEEELRLNRRLAPGVYLGVVPFAARPDGGLRLRGPGAAVEWGVEMVRLPAESMLDRLLERGEVDNAALDALAARLVRFHAEAATGPGVDEHGAPDAVASIVLDNFAALAPTGLAPSLLLERLEQHARDRLAAHRPLLAARVAAGRIREGHGDLHAGNLCRLPAGWVAYDALEFSAALRCCDVAADLAFLVMDLARRGLPAFGTWLARRYAERAGDGDLARLMPFYVAYRALVRAKVAALAHAQLASRGAPPPGARFADEAPERLERHEALERKRREVVALCVLAARGALPPMLVLTCGLPAGGKSWLARRAAEALDAAWLRSDVRRKALAGVPATSHRAPPGLYATEMTGRTYGALLHDAREALAAGRTVIVDATFPTAAARAPFVALAREAGVPLRLLHCEADESLVRARMAARLRDPDEVSDADFGVYLAARARFEPPAELSPSEVLNFASGARAAEDELAELVAGLPWTAPA